MSVKNGIIVGLLILLTGCIQSLNPLYKEADLLFDSRLVGTWSEENSKDKWVFAKSEKEEKTYILTHFEGRKKSKLIVHLLKLGNYMYLDFYPAEPENDTALYAMSIFPIHTFSMVKFENKNLIIDFGFWDKAFKNQNVKLPQVASSGKYGAPLLTASTESMQQAIKKYVNEKNAFLDTTVLTRK